MKFYKMLHLKSLMLFVIFGIAMVPMVSMALNSISTGWRVGNSNVKIDAHGVCKNVKASGNNVFVPTKTAAEWSAFRENKPSSVTLEACSYNYKSCQDILNAGASTGDGVYMINPFGTNPSTQFPVYCDMTTDGGGWTLISAGGHSSPCQASHADNPNYITYRMYQKNPPLTLSMCGYLSRSKVRAIAQHSTTVRLRSGRSHSSYSQVMSMNSKAIEALQTDTNWRSNGAAWTPGWQWRARCGDVSSHKWPNMYWSCGYTNGVHWIWNAGQAKSHINPSDQKSSTWIGGGH